MERIPLAVPDLTGNEARYLQECITSTFVSSVGPFVNRFESMVALSSGANGGAVAVSSGTCGLHAALIALGVGHGDLVIVPSLTFIASANAVAHCGAIPWILDVLADSWNLDPGLLEVCLTSETVRRDQGLVHRASGRRVAAVMAVHTVGLLADMESILRSARMRGVPVIADAAAALGATHQGRGAGALGADLSVFSFNGNKTITCGGGGAVVGDDPDKVALVRHLTTTARLGVGYDHDRVGFNYRMTNLQAAVGCAQMERLEPLVAAKRRIRARYDAAFADLEGVRPFPSPPGSHGACWFSGLVVTKELSFVKRLQAGLLQAGIEARSFWKPIHLQLPFQEAPRTPQPVSEQLWLRIVTLPCSAGLSWDDQERVISAVRTLVTE